MGILNVTPDSFYHGGRHMLGTEMLNKVKQMLTEGAAIIDIGGMSSRPGAEMISTEEELQRVITAIELLVSEFEGILISVDTFRAEVARKAIEAGAVMVNDISAGNMDEAMFPTVAELQVPYIAMHMQGTPATMQANPQYDDVMAALTDFFIEKVSRLQQLGVNDILLDPGLGFGKTVAHNYEILKKLHYLQPFELPLMIGLSRKSMICKVLKVNPEDALNGTTALHSLALLNGASLLRVHDVKAASQVIELMQQYQNVE